MARRSASDAVADLGVGLLLGSLKVLIGILSVITIVVIVGACYIMFAAFGTKHQLPSDKYDYKVTNAVRDAENLIPDDTTPRWMVSFNVTNNSDLKIMSVDIKGDEYLCQMPQDALDTCKLIDSTTKYSPIGVMPGGTNSSQDLVDFNGTHGEPGFLRARFSITKVMGDTHLDSKI